MLPLSNLLSLFSSAPTWHFLWCAANQARDAGRPEKALELYAKAVALSPTSPQVYLDAGIHSLKVNLAFQGVDDLYRRHAADFSLPESLGRNVLKRLSDGQHSRSFALSALLSASALAPVTSYQRLLAQAFSHLGHPRHALAILRRIQGDELASLRDDREYGRLLARANPADAVFYYQGLLVRWPSATDLFWHLLAAQVDSRGESEAQTTYAALRYDLAASDTPDERQVHSLALLAWAMYMRPAPVMAQRALADFAPLFALASRLYPSSAAAQLATGFGALLEGRLKTGKQALALASLPRHKPASDDDNTVSGHDALPNLIEPLETAIRALLTIDAASTQLEKIVAAPLTKDAQEHISAMQAGALLHEQDLFGALMRFGDTIAPHVVHNSYNLKKMGLEELVVHSKGLYYALPRMIPNLAIIDGRFYQIPEQLFNIRQTMPPPFMRIARPVAKWIIGLISRYSLLRSFGRCAVKVALSRYMVRGVLVDSNYDNLVIKVRERASKLPGLFSAKFGTVDFTTSNVQQNASPLGA